MVWRQGKGDKNVCVYLLMASPTEEYIRKGVFTPRILAELVKILENGFEKARSRYRRFFIGLRARSGYICTRAVESESESESESVGVDSFGRSRSRSASR